jgi:formamidopyrimidine-DNA glycosylase
MLAGPFILFLRSAKGASSTAISAPWAACGSCRQRGRQAVKGYDNLGPDAISPDFTTERLYDLLKGCHRPVKMLLLDQTKVAGLGNIYVDEALFRAGIRPMRHSDTVTQKEAARLHEAIVAVLQEGLEHGGTTIRNFISSNGKEGQNQENLRVYGREGTPCTVCGTTIEYTKLNGRGTHYCPKCQS